VTGASAPTTFFDEYFRKKAKNAVTAQQKRQTGRTYS